MSFAPHLEMITEVLPLNRKDFVLDAATLPSLNPVAANPLLDGEWLQMTAAGVIGRGGAAPADVKLVTFQLWSERGRYDTQAIQKVTTLYIGGYEAETDICDVTGLALNDLLVVGDVTVSALTKKGLKKLPAGAGAYFVIGMVTKLYTSPNKVRFLKFAAPMHVTQ